MGRNGGGQSFLYAMLYALCVVGSYFFGVGCAAEQPRLIAYSYPFSPEGKTILIEHFAFNPGISTKVNRAAVERFGELIALDIQRFLGKAKFKHPLVVAPGEAAQGDFLIRGTITRVHGGDSWERRTGEVFGFGATEVTATGEVVDLAASQSVTAFSFTKKSSYAWTDNESAVRENLREIAQEIAAILMQGK